MTAQVITLNPATEERGVVRPADPSRPWAEIRCLTRWGWEVTAQDPTWGGGAPTWLTTGEQWICFTYAGAERSARRWLRRRERAAARRRAAGVRVIQ